MPKQPVQSSVLKGFLILSSVLILGMAVVFVFNREETTPIVCAQTQQAQGPESERWTNSIGMTFVEVCGTVIMNHCRPE